MQVLNGKIYMSKRTATASTTNNPKNYHPTPFEAALPLARILPPFTRYDEPCAADGQLIDHLSRWGHQCVTACDVLPKAAGIMMMDATALPRDRMVITNPPFAWPLLKPLMDHWVGHVPTWLLLPWDMPANLYMVPYAAHIDRILPLGRVSWMRNGQGGMDNYGWYRFSVEPHGLVLPRMKQCNTVGS